MKKFLVALLEGTIVGILLAIVIIVFDIDVTTTQTMILLFTSIIGTSIASSIGQTINTGKAPVFYEWVYNHDGYRIAVSAGLTEKLYINDELVDHKKGVTIKKVELEGQLETGEKVRAVITGGMTAKCEVHVGNKRLEVVSTKTP